MRILPKFLAILAGCFFIFAGLAGADSQPPAEGGQFPEMSFAVPKNPQFQQYLGVSGKTTFTIPEIVAEVVLIEIFSMY